MSEIVETLAQRLARACVGGCICGTKPPAPQCHDPHCHYRLFSEAMTALAESFSAGMRAAADMVDAPMSAILLAAGEMSAQEKRSVKAVLTWRERVIRDAADKL